MLTQIEEPIDERAQKYAWTKQIWKSVFCSKEKAKTITKRAKCFHIQKYKD